MPRDLTTDDINSRRFNRRSLLKSGAAAGAGTAVLGVAPALAGPDDRSGDACPPRQRSNHAHDRDGRFAHRSRSPFVV